MPSRGTWTSWRVDPCEPHEVQQAQGKGPVHRSGQPAVSIKAGGWRD